MFIPIIKHVHHLRENWLDMTQECVPEGGQAGPCCPIQLPRLPELVQVIALLVQAQSGQLFPQTRQEGFLQQLAHHAVTERLLSDDQLIGVNVGGAGKSGDTARPVPVLVEGLEGAGYRRTRFLAAVDILLLPYGFFALRHILKEREKLRTKVLKPQILFAEFILT